MKRCFLLLGLLISCSVAFSQQTATDFDQRLLAKYSAEQIRELQKTQPQLIAYWTFYLDNAYTIEDIYTEKEVPFSGTIKLKDPQSFNILASEVTMNRDKATFYRIKNSNKILVVHSGRNITNAFNNTNR